MSHIAGIQEETIVDGLGIRFSVYFSGCSHHCKNCHNPETWDFNYGTEYNEMIDEIIEKIRSNKDVLDGITLSGGDPLHQDNQHDVLDFIRRVKSEFPDMNIWIYTGYKIEQLIGFILCSCGYLYDILNLIDVLVDGEFIEELKDLDLWFRGSSNQRIIDVKKTLEINKGRLMAGDLDNLEIIELDLNK